MSGPGLRAGEQIDGGRGCCKRTCAREGLRDIHNTINGRKEEKKRMRDVKGRQRTRDSQYSVCFEF
jgi:hypothetical protein